MPRIYGSGLNIVNQFRTSPLIYLGLGVIFWGLHLLILFLVVPEHRDLSMTNSIFTVPSSNPFGLTNIRNHVDLNDYIYSFGIYTAPTLADIDGDGDLDIFIGAIDGNIYYQQNTGTRTIPAFTTPVDNPFGLDNVYFTSTPTFVDIDRDNDLDAFIGNGDGEIYYFENIGNATFTTAVTNPFGLTNVDLLSIRPTFVDIDGDNDLDAFVGAQDGNIYFFANTGTTSVPNFPTRITNPFGLTNNNNIIVTSSPTFADIDGDNDFDAFVGAEDGNIYYFTNTGTATAANFATPVPNPLGLTDVGVGSSPTFADINGDGDLDGFVGTQDGDIYYFDNNTSPTITGAIPDQAVNDNALIHPFSNVTIGDIDGDNLNVTIALDSSAKGTLSTVTLSGTTVTLSGTSVSVTADLRALTFNPTDNRVTPGQTETSSFTLTVSDGLNTPITDTITTVISTSINDAPVVDNPIPNQTAANTSFTYTFPSDTFRDDDVGQTLSYSATGLPNGVTFDANTRTFSGTPATGSDITVTASDGIASVSNTFELFINIQGDSRANTLVGTTGEDMLTGLQGRDILTGGAGSDIFRYMSMVDAGDTITDFQVGIDKIDFSNLMRSIGYTGNNNPLVDQYVRFVDRGNNVTVQIDPDGTGPTVSSNYIFTIRNVTVAQMNDVNNFIF